MSGPTGRFQCGIDADISFPFANMFKNSRGFGPANKTDLAALNNDGIPVSALTQNTGNSQFFIPQSYSGAWVLGFQNWQGAFQFQGLSTAVLNSISTTNCTFSGSNATMVGDGRVSTSRLQFTFNTPPSTVNLIFPGGAFTYAAGGGTPWVYFCRLADEAAILAAGVSGIVFNPDYVNSSFGINALNLQCARVFGWFGGNGQNLSQHVNRAPLTAIAWIANQYPTACLLTGGGAISGTDNYTSASYPNMPGTPTGTGVISGSTLTLSGTTGTWLVDQTVIGGTLTGTKILPYGTNGTTGVGGNGTYALNYSQSVGSQAMTGGYVDGEVCIGSFANTNTIAKPTLNVGTRGDVQISTQPIDVTTSAGIGASALSTTAVYAFVFNAITNRWIAGGGGIAASIPVEVCVALCNALNVDMWINAPYMYSQAAIAQWVTYLKNNLNSGLTLHIEWANEVWNTAAGFSQTGFAKQMSISIGSISASDVNTGYAYMACEAFTTIKNTWGADAAAGPYLQLVASGSLFDTGSGPGSSAVRWGCSQLNSVTSPSYAGKNYTTVGSRLVDIISPNGHFAYAQYWSGYYFRNFFGGIPAPFDAALTAADDYDSGDPTRQQRALDFVTWDVMQAPNWGQTINDVVTSHYPAWQTIAATTFSGTGLVPATGLPIDCYEGACEAWFPSAGQVASAGIAAGYQAKLQNLIIAWKQDARAQRIYSFSLSQWKAFSHNRMPSNSTFCGALQWATKVNDLYSTNNGCFSSIKTFSNPVNGGRIGRF